MDRLISAIHDKGLVYVFLTWRHFPAKSIRNILIFIISLCFFILFILRAKITSIRLAFVFILISLPLSFISVYVGVLFTSILSYIKRAYVIKKAKSLLSESNIITIGITGSYGKTTTKEYLYTMLSSTFKVAKTDANMNTDVGVAISILKNVKRETQIFIAEMGAYKRGEIRAICNLIQPTYGIITGIGNQHLDLFGSKQNLIDSKKELLLSLPQSGKAYINKGTYQESIFEKDAKSRLFFYVGVDTSSNLIPCIELAKDLGIAQEKINTAIADIQKITNSLTPLRYKGGGLILDNSYNTSVEGFINTINVLAQRNEQKKIIVSRGILELGTDKKTSYEKILQALNASKIILFTTDHDFKINDYSSVVYFKSETDLSSTIINELKEQVIVAFEGRYDKRIINKLKNT